MARQLSGIQPTSEPTLGNYLGALRRWADNQQDGDFWMIADLHSLTIELSPETLRDRTLSMANTLLSVGIDPHVCSLFIQSHVPAHSQLSWLLECTASFGELRRMTQFKEKAGENEGSRAGLFTYPCLMAADILLYDIDEVPVGDDQRQHVELTRDIAMRFNSRYGQTFTVPKATMPASATRVRDLQDPTKKMSKSLGGQGTVWLNDSAEIITKKIKRAVTDAENEVRYDWEAGPGVSNLLEIMAACTGDEPQALAANYSQYGELKSDVADAVVELLAPVQERFAELQGDPATTMGILAAGAEHAAEVANATLRRAQENIGLIVRS